jgi:excinuclease UvrABC nuclease subunit
MMQNELKHLLALQRVKGIGNITKRILLEEYGSAQAVFEEIKSLKQSPFAKRRLLVDLINFNK